jgi:hypothetical protein
VATVHHRAIEDKAIEDKAIEDKAIEDKAIEDKAIEDKAIEACTGLLAHLKLAITDKLSVAAFLMLLPLVSCFVTTG